MEEIFDIIDTQGNPTGETVTREKAHAEGIPHRTAHIWIIREKYGRTEVLLQKRSMNKDSFPGKFDTSSAGHIQAGDEPLESALRELGEELGIQASSLYSPEHSRFRLQKNFMAKCFEMKNWLLYISMINR